MQIEFIRQRLRAAGAKPLHEQRVLRHWLHALPLEAGRQRIEHFLPRSLREGLPSTLAELHALVQLHAVHADADGAERLLLRLADGAIV